MIDSRKAYVSCFRFLEEIYWMNRALYDDDLPGLLSNMQAGLDPAVEEDWTKATSGQEQMSIEFAYESMLRFLQIYIDLGEADTQDITKVLHYVESDRAKHFTRWVELAAQP